MKKVSPMMILVSGAVTLFTAPFVLPIGYFYWILLAAILGYGYSYTKATRIVTKETINGQEAVVTYESRMGHSGINWMAKVIYPILCSISAGVSLALIYIGVMMLGTYPDFINTPLEKYKIPNTIQEGIILFGLMLIIVAIIPSKKQETK